MQLKLRQAPCQSMLCRAAQQHLVHQRQAAGWRASELRMCCCQGCRAVKLMQRRLACAHCTHCTMLLEFCLAEALC